MFENHRAKRRLGHVIITPLIDVMFYLVAFLLVFGTFRTETTGMPMELPRAATPSDLAREHIIVAIDSSGRIYYDERIVVDGELTTGLLPRLAANPDRLVIIKADKSVTYERLIQVIDAIRMAGGVHLALAVERAPQSGGVER
ncbi:MAG: biopolymer transporter ExbD [Bacillota bacterium]|jgi:biopolymer transport protein ExbD|nr:biopolymer transporter ExbD [Bacillota bacterium]HPZ13635.1 biopolymer transporter ExbD [Bacillota bacterium]HQD80012.1 biopolymer transporter ExbD [Bacillota bacterium]